MVKVICRKAHRRHRRMVQCYSTGDGNVSSHEAHWHHLANTIELVHPSAHSSPQSKRQMYRFSRFYTGYSRKCLYFTMGAPIHQNCPFKWGIWTCHVTHDALGPCEPTNKRHLDRFSRVCTDYRGVTLYWFACFPLKIVPSHVGIWTSCNTWFIGPTRVRKANVNLIVSAVFADRPTDHASGCDAA